MLITGSQGRAEQLTATCPAALPVTSNQQAVDDTDRPCPGPHSLSSGSLWKREGALVGEARLACQRTTLDYSPPLKIHDLGVGKVSGLYQEKHQCEPSAQRTCLLQGPQKA